MNHTERMKEIEMKQRQLADELAALKKEMEKPEGYRKPERGEKYFVAGASGADDFAWSNGSVDNFFYDYGNLFHTEPEAQRVADMLNYFFLVQKKAREMGGLIGYGSETQSKNPHSLFMCNGYLHQDRCSDYMCYNPLNPILTKSCAETLSKDPEVIKAVKLAWGVK